MHKVARTFSAFLPWIKTLIRAIVVTTNPFPPFNRINRLPYALAIRRIKRLATSFPGISSVYLRHGLTRPDWEPGLSDIDLTVVLDSDLSPEEEYENAQKFMDRYHALGHWFPMLGEVEILSGTCCSAWSRFSIRGSEAGNWKLLCGTDTVKSAYVQNEIRMRKDSLDHACWLYESYILRRFYANEPDTWIGSKALLRIARKVLRYARGEPAPGADERIILHSQPSAIVLRLLENLDAQAQEALKLSTLESPSLARPAQLPDAAVRPGYFAHKYARLGEYDSIIYSVTLSFSTSFIILKDGISLDALEDDLDRIREICRADGIQPYIATRSLFQYYLQSYRPRVFLELREYRYILCGVDLLREITPPSEQSLAAELLNQSLNCMLAPARYAGKHSSAMRARDWAVDAWRSAFLLLFLDNGLIGSHERSVKACREHFPELCSEINRLTENMDANENLARSVHALLRRRAMDINRQIEGLALDRLPGARIMREKRVE